MKKNIIIIIISFFVFCLKVNALELTNYAKSAVLIEPTTNTIIYDYNMNERRAPASMTKIMTMLLIMESIDNGKINWDDEVLISQNAAGMGGSQIFLEANSKIKVEELLKGIAIASGNDAAVAMAEHIAGSTNEFVKMMNEKAKELGLKDTNFENVHGLDSENHYSTAYDMAQIAKELLKHERILEFTSLYEEYLEKPDGTKTWLVNTNKLVRFYEGVDGLKTGFTSTAGYCLTSTAKKNNIRFISVVMGVDTSEHRSADTTSMLNYGFSNYKLNTILTTNDSVGNIIIKKGQKRTVNIMPLENINDLIKQNEEKNYSYNLKKYDITAPVYKGDVVGTLEIIDNNGKVLKEINVTVSENVKKNTFISLFKNYLKKIINGYK